MSRPTRARGLKCLLVQLQAPIQPVAPHAGAWIEIRGRDRGDCSIFVAPHAGAWIEMICRAGSTTFLIVAPHAGAWIEIFLDKLLNS